MSKAKRKHLIASLLMLSLGSCPVLAKTVPATPIDGNASGAAIFVTGSSSTEQEISFDLTPYDGEISGWNGIYGGIVNMYSGKNITVTGAIQSYTNNKSGTAAGSSPSVGGAIANMANSANETFTLSGNEIAFANNSSDRGGAIYNETGAFVFNADTISFDGNTAVNSGTWQGGGAILNIDGNVSVKEGATLSFIGNTTNGTDTNASHGGAIYNGSFLEGYTGTVDLSNAAKVTFTGNEATGAVSSGGAIMNENGSVKLGDNVVFQKNEAANSGGAVMNTTGTENASVKPEPTASFSIGSNAQFKQNTAGSGAAIYNQRGEINIGSGAKFYNNTANSYAGGAIYSETVAGYPESVVNIGEKAEFVGNKSETSHGGAIFQFISNADDTKSNINIASGALFKNNESEKTGGAIANWGGDLTVDNATFTGNKANTSGGAIYNDTYVNTNGGATVTITGGTKFENNTAATSGGAIANAADSVIALDTTTGNITFTGNTTGAEGEKVLNDINTDGTVNITGDTNRVSVNTITGSDTGVINKTGANTLVLNDNNSGFLGNFTQTAGKTEVLKEFFGGDSTVESSSVDMKDGSSVVESATVTLGNKGIINIVEDANVKINGTVEANTAKNDAAINNDGNIEVNGTLIADVIQDSTDASITVNNGAKFGTQNDGSAIAAGSLTIKQGAVIDGIVEITEAVKLDFDGVPTVFDKDGLKVGGGHITNEGTFNLANTAIGVEVSGLNDSVTLSNGSSLSPATAGETTIHLGNGDSTDGTPTITYSDDAVTNAEHSLNVNKDATLKLAPTKGNNFELNSKVTSADGEGQVLVDQIKVKNPNYVDDATTPDEEEFIEQGVGTITVNSDNSGFKGSFLQNMGNLILAAGSKFFGGQNKIDGGSVTVQKDAVLTGAYDNATQVTGGALNLADGAILDKNVTVTTDADDDSYGTVNLYNAIKGEVGEDGVTRISADSIANGNDGTLTYVNSDDSEKTISITNGAGLGLFNGVRVEGDSLALQQDKGVRDLTFGNGSGSETNSIVLNENTKLTYRDGAYIKDDSTVDMKDGASLNLANNTTDVTYNPIISGTANSTINKTGNGSTVIASALDKFTGNLNVLGGALELATAEDKTFNNLNVQNADFHAASNIAVQGAEGDDTAGNVNIANSNFAVDKTLEASGDLKVGNSTVDIAENLGGSDTTMTGSTVNVGKDMSTYSLNLKETDLNVAGNLYNGDPEDGTGSAILEAANVAVGGNLDANNITANDTNLVVNGDVTAKDTVLTDSAVNLNGKTSTFDNLTLAGTTLNNMTNMTVGNDLIFGAGADGANSTLNMTNGTVNTITANNTVLNSDLNIAFDVDPSKGYAMDSIQTNTFTDNGNQLIVGGINFVSSPIDRNFAVDASKFINSGDGNVASFGESSFLANTHLGQYLMSTGAGGGSVIAGSLQSINPQMYRGQVATVASYMNQLVVNNMLFDHMEVITRQMMAQERTANKYSATEPLFAPYQYSAKDGTLWYKAYANFERLSMTQGLSVGNNAYGSLIGADFPLVELENGWKIIPTAYVAYNGAHQHFNGVSMYQNGGQIGAMGTAYKGDFLTSLLVYGGGYANDMNVNNAAFGSASDTTGNWFAGVASKTAYNFHVAKDFIVQPTALVSYNMFGNQNWHSNFGAMGMNAGFMNGINIAPGLNLILNKKTWSLYATVQYMYNIMGGVDGRAGNVTLDGVRMRHGYLEYGIGATKTFKDRLTSYFQITLRNVGRTGIGFQFGLNWKI